MTDEVTALLDIPVKLEAENVLKVMRLRQRNKGIEEIVHELLEIARPIARPKAVYKVAYIDRKDGDAVTIDGVTFQSRLLRINLDKVERVFPYVATCGRELEEIAVPPGDFLKAFCLDAIKTTALGAAIGYLNDYLNRCYAVGKMSHLNPGSVDAWPVTQQRELFSLFGDVEKLIGVRLTEGCVMYPLKSVSGICYPTEVHFESCQLCPRDRCIGRRAPYDAELAKKYKESVPA